MEIADVDIFIANVHEFYRSGNPPVAAIAERVMLAPGTRCSLREAV